MFQGLSTDQLNKLRSAWMSNLSMAEGDILIGLLGKDESTWKASDKINFDYYMKKWKPTVAKPIVTPSVSTTAPKPPVTAPAPTTTSTSSSTGKYDPTKDVNYDEKVGILSKWYDYVVATNKKRIIPRYVPSKNSFEGRFLPWTVNDLNAYTGLVYMGEKNRGVRENDIMKDLKKKYPASFSGNDTIYSFTGSPVMLSNKTNWRF
jgi:hypothetical protein